MRRWLLRLLGADEGRLMQLEAENAAVLLANKMLVEREEQLRFWNEALQRALDVADTYPPRTPS